MITYKLDSMEPVMHIVVIFWGTRCTFYLHGAKNRSIPIRYNTRFIKYSIVFILLKRYNTNPFQTSKHRSTVDTFVVSASGLLLVFNRHILAGSLLEDTASIYCSAFGTANGCSSLRTHFRIPSEIFSVVEWDWPWPALLRAASTPLSNRTKQYWLARFVIRTGEMLDFAYQERLAVL